MVFHVASGVMWKNPKVWLGKSLRNRRQPRKSWTQFNFFENTHDRYVRKRECNVSKCQEKKVALEIGQRKFDALYRARKISFLRTFTICTYVNVRQQKRDSGNPPLKLKNSLPPKTIFSNSLETALDL